MLDLDPWLSPLDGANPSGMSLRDDPRFHEIERLIPPIPRDQNNKPDPKASVVIDWGEVLERAEALRAEGRDLRLLVIVARALGNERGFAGLADGLDLIARTLEAHWDTLHPELRPAATPKGAAQRRLNALLQLQGEDDGLLGDFERKVFFEARGFGAVTGGDLARGSIDARAAVAERTRGLGERERAALTAGIAAEHEALVGRVRSALAARTRSDPAEMTALLAGSRAAAAAFAGVDRALAARTGIEGEIIELQPMRRYLRQATATLEYAAAQQADTAPEAAAQAPAGAPAAAGAPLGVPGRLTSRQDVIDYLDRIIDFYDRTEPASPVPFLARRMRRMVPMDFLELMEDLAPSGIKEFRQLAGLSDKASSRTQGDKT